MRASTTVSLCLIFSVIMCLSCSKPQTPPQPPAQKAEAAQPGSSTISVALNEVRGMKPPLQTFRLKLKIVNNRNHPVWYVTRFYGEEPLATTEPFKTRQPWDNGCFTINAYNGDRFGGKGRFRVFRFIGPETPDKQKHSFVAFLLPAGAKLDHEYFGIEAWEDIDTFEIWEASALKVNGTTPLEDWLPCVMAATPDTKITREAELNEMDSGAFEFKPGKTVDDFPKDEVKRIEPVVLEKHTLKIEDIKK